VRVETASKSSKKAGCIAVDAGARRSVGGLRPALRGAAQLLKRALAKIRENASMRA